jgi:hypothetical protein
VKGDSHRNGYNKLANVPDPQFVQFWAAYPKKCGKSNAEKAWNTIGPNEALFRLIMSKVEEAKKTPEWTKEGGKYIPYPSTYLNGKRWEDEYQAVVQPKVQQRSHSVIERRLRQATGEEVNP